MWWDPFLSTWKRCVQSCLVGSGANANLCPDAQHWQSPESLGISGSVSRQDLCLGRGVVFSQKLGWQQLQAVPALTVMLGGFGIFYCYKSLTC